MFSLVQCVILLSSRETVVDTEELDREDEPIYQVNITITTTITRSPSTRYPGPPVCLWIRGREGRTARAGRGWRMRGRRGWRGRLTGSPSVPARRWSSSRMTQLQVTLGLQSDFSIRISLVLP